MMDKNWSELLVIRPEANAARLEDSEAHDHIVMDSDILAVQVMQEEVTLGGRTLAQDPILDDVAQDWVDHGWRPSLDYFNWSETQEPLPTQTLEHVAAPELTGNGSLEPGWGWGGRSLDPASSAVKTTVGELLLGRRTVRDYEKDPLTVRDFSLILENYHRLLSSNEGAGEPYIGLRLEAIVYAVETISPGIWTVDRQNETMTRRANEVPRQAVADLMCGMQAPITASATMVFVVHFPTRQAAYPYERALRELYIEVGRLAQKFILAAEIAGCGALITPATNDNVLSKLLQLRDDEAPIYTVTFGKKHAASSRVSG